MDRAFSVALALAVLCAACRQAPYESRRVWDDGELEPVAISDTTVMARRLPDGPGRHEVPIGALAPGAALVRVGVESAKAVRVAVRLSDQPDGACRLEYPSAGWRGCRLEIARGADAAQLVVQVEGEADVRTAVGSPLLRARGAPRRAPVFVLLLDTLRFDHLASYRPGFALGTELARLADDGVVFEHAYSSSSWTRTAVATLLTGLEATTHGVFGRSDVLSERLERLPEIFQRAGYCTAAWSTNPNVLPLWGFARGFDAFSDVGAVHWADKKKTDARVVVARARRALDEHAGFPCLYYLHFMDPHPPYTPRPEDLKAVAEDPRLAGIAPGPLSPEQEEEYRKYLAEILGMDRAIGELRSMLEESGTYGPAAILVVSDHGEEFHDHGGLGHGHTLYEELVRVPIFLKLPGNARARTREGQEIGMSDVAPTLLAALGLPPLAAADGRNVWDQQPARPPTAILRLDGHRQAAIVAGRRKLIVDEEAADELYDLREDPGERRNLAPAEATDLAALRTLLDARLALRGAGWHLRACGGEHDTTQSLRLDLAGDGHLALAEPDDRLATVASDGPRRTLRADLVLPAKSVPHVALGVWRDKEVRDSDEVVLTPEASGVTVRAESEGTLRYALGTETARRTAPVLELDAATPGVEVAPTTAIECAPEKAPPDDPLPYVRIWYVRPSASLDAMEVSPEVQERLRALGYQW
jgi:arylsulfatase A-like enzyme